MTTPPPERAPTRAFLAHDDFVSAWREGELLVDIDSVAAASLVSARLLLPFVAVAIIGMGIGLVLWGWLWTGLAVGTVGVLAPRLVKRSAHGFLLERVAEDPELYAAALECKALSYARKTPAA